MTPSDLLVELDRYLLGRQAVGLKEARHRKLLREFIQYLADHPADENAWACAAYDWACATPCSTAIHSQRCRLQVVRGFLLFLKSSHPTIQVPESALLASYHRNPPFLFTPEQIRQLMRAAFQLGPKKSLRPHTCQTVLGLIASTGLRAGEAVGLKLSQVQLEANPPRLLIENTKFHKSRWVIIHATVADALKKYRQQRLSSGSSDPDAPFFLSTRGKPITYYHLRAWFAVLRKKLGLSAPSTQRQPCLHSFRHTFAVERLKSWYQQSRDIHALAPNLAVYLGHASLTDCYWYLSAVPELLGLAGHRFGRFAGKEGPQDVE